MAKKPIEKNERAKREYLTWRKHAGRLSDKSRDKEAAALNRFDEWNGYKDFAKFHIEQAIGFCGMLESEVNERTGEPLSASTRRAILAPLRSFIIWLADKPGYRSRIRMQDAEYFNLSRHDEEIARHSEPRRVPTPEQARHALAQAPCTTAIEKRDKAIFALFMLTAARIGALISFRIRHVDIEARALSQPGKDVATKFRKTMRTYFQPGYDEAEAAVAEWLIYQRDVMLRGGSDPLFPATEIGVGENGGFQAVGLTKAHWSDTEPPRKIVRAIWENAGIEYFHPHSFRHMHVTAAMRAGATVEQLTAIGQNVGHENIATTIGSYGQLTEDRRRELILGAG